MGDDARIDTELRVRRLAGSLGAEVTGLDLREADPADVLSLLHEHMVLFFPDQHLSAQEHVAFGRRFGPIEGHPHLRNAAEDESILELSAAGGHVADEWHSDISFAEHPALYSILKVVECPAHGGDTMWSNAAKAFDELSPALQDLCEGLTALHDAHPHGRPDKTWIHPVVRVHPVTGRKVLFVNEHFTRRIVELSAEESAALLGLLTGWVSKPQFTVRYAWNVGTVAMWDNRCTQHMVLNDFTGGRVIQRVTVMGDTVDEAKPARWRPHTERDRVGDQTRFDRQLRKHLEAHPVG